MKNYAEISHEIMQAYIDCWDLKDWQKDFDRVTKARNLNFRASAPLMQDQAIAVFKKAVPHGYNNFRADLLLALPEGCKVTVAREGSVCIYVDPKPSDDVIARLMVDESDDYQGKGWRLWWD